MLESVVFSEISRGKPQLDKQIEIVLSFGYALQAGSTASVGSCTVPRAWSIRMVRLLYQSY